MEVRIRKGTSADFSQLLGLVKELAVFERSANMVENSVEQMEKEKDEFGFFVAEDVDVIVGMAVYSKVYSTWFGKSLYLDDIYIKESYRGKKIGTKLLRAVFEIAKQEHCHRLRWQVMSWNTQAIEFYKKIGADIDPDVQNCDFYEDTMDRFLTSTE